MNWLRWLSFPTAATWARKQAHLIQLDRLILGPQHSLHLIQVGRTQLLVGRSPSGLSVLHHWFATDPEEELL